MNSGSGGIPFFVETYYVTGREFSTGYIQKLIYYSRVIEFLE